MITSSVFLSTIMARLVGFIVWIGEILWTIFRPWERNQDRAYPIWTEPGRAAVKFIGKDQSKLC